MNVLDKRWSGCDAAAVPRRRHAISPAVKITPSASTALLSFGFTTSLLLCSDAIAVRW